MAAGTPELDQGLLGCLDPEVLKPTCPQNSAQCLADMRAPPSHIDIDHTAFTEIDGRMLGFRGRF